MIEINLLPEELRVKSKGTKRVIGEIIEKKHFLYLMPVVIGFLLLLHIIFAISSLLNANRLRVLNKQWSSLKPQKKELEEFNKQYGILSEESKAAKQLIEGRVNWAEKLNKLSLYLPSGVWFRDLSMSQKNFKLEGSAVSLQKEEMGLIKDFIDSLKNDSGFFKDFAGLELSSAQTRILGGYEIIDFAVSGTLK